MDSWGIEPPPLTRACVGCGGAFRYLSRIQLCDACEEDYNADMAEVEARERYDDDQAARRSFYNG